MSTILTRVPIMGKSKRDDTTVKIDSAVYRKAKLVATLRGITLAELLSDLLRKPVDAEYAKATKEMNSKE